MVATSWISCFLNFCCMHLLKSLYFLSIRSLLWFFFFDNIHGLYFHFYLYSVGKENAFHFEKFEKYFFFCLLQFCYTIANVCRSLLSMVVCSNVEPELFRCVTKLHQISLSTNKDCFLFFHLFTTCSIQVPNGFP
jgi:hypothetical protein